MTTQEKILKLLEEQGLHGQLAMDLGIEIASGNLTPEDVDEALDAYCSLNMITLTEREEFASEVTEYALK